MQKRVLSVLSTTVVAFGLAGAPAYAQQPAAPTPQTSATPSAAYTDAQLEKFIAASRKVAVISQEYTPRIESTSDQQEREQIFREADEKMVTVVQDEGLSVNEFNGINQALQQDPELEQRVTRMLD